MFSKVLADDYSYQVSEKSGYDKDASNEIVEEFREAAERLDKDQLVDMLVAVERYRMAMGRASEMQAIWNSMAQAGGRAVSERAAVYRGIEGDLETLLYGSMLRGENLFDAYEDMFD